MPKYPLIFGALLAAICWAMTWPELESEPVSETSTRIAADHPRHFARTSEEWRELTSALNDSSDTMRQRAAARSLERLKRSEIHDLLLGMTGDFDRWNFPAAPQLLLVELARRDPADAMMWSWVNLREARGWTQAFKQIGPQWAWDDPEGFAQFVKEHYHERSAAGDLTMEDLLASPEPLLNCSYAHDAKKWLVKSSPRLVFQMIRLAGISRYHSENVKALNSEADFLSALSVWDDYDPQAERMAREAYDAAFAKVDLSLLHSEERATASVLQGELLKVEHPSCDTTVKEIVKRWKLIDPEGFAESSYQSWDKGGE